MPRPARKPKKYKPSEAKQGKIPGDVVNVPVMSTPLATKQITAVPASPALSAIEPEKEIVIYQDPQEHSDEFGFHTVKGIKKSAAAAVESVYDQRASDQLPDSYPADDEEDIYGEQLPLQEPSSDIVGAAPPKAVPPRPLKLGKKLRTSELLSLLPARRKRHQPPRQRKKMPTLNTSDIESETNIPAKPKAFKRRRAQADKENDSPGGSENEVEENPEVEGRREIVKAKFAEVDRWDLAFETVDVSFSSQ